MSAPRASLALPFEPVLEVISPCRWVSISGVRRGVRFHKRRFKRRERGARRTELPKLFVETFLFDVHLKRLRKIIPERILDIVVFHIKPIFDIHQRGRNAWYAASGGTGTLSVSRATRCIVIGKVLVRENLPGRRPFVGVEREHPQQQIFRGVIAPCERVRE